MKTVNPTVTINLLFRRLLPVGACLAFAAIATAQNTAPLAPLTISDVPRATQIGSGPVPAGAPGNGRYVPPVPADTNLPTLWLIGDSTVRNGTLGDNGPAGQWGWGAPITAYFDLKKINVVNRAFGDPASQLHERHDASDFETKTQDKLTAGG